MDIQLKKGLLEACVLTAMLHENSYGYKIIKDISKYIEISESTLYPILRRLEGSGALTVYSAEHNGRLRKYYAITPLGRKKITDFLNEWKSVMSIYKYIESEVNGNE